MFSTSALKMKLGNANVISLEADFTRMSTLEREKDGHVPPENQQT